MQTRTRERREEVGGGEKADAEEGAALVQGEAEIDEGGEQRLGEGRRRRRQGRAHRSLINVRLEFFNQFGALKFEH